MGSARWDLPSSSMISVLAVIPPNSRPSAGIACGVESLSPPFSEVSLVYTRALEARVEITTALTSFTLIGAESVTIPAGSARNEIARDSFPA